MTPTTPPEPAASAAAPASATAPLDAEFIAALHHLFEERIAFNKLIGLRIDAISAAGVTGHIESRPDLIGHELHRRLHGGVISSALDSMGGIAVLAMLGARYPDENMAQRIQRFSKLGTIDLRIDYLRPAIGLRFAMRAGVLRLGTRLAATRMEFTDSEGLLLSTGSAAYIVA